MGLAAQIIGAVLPVTLFFVYRQLMRVDRSRGGIPVASVIHGTTWSPPPARSSLEVLVSALAFVMTALMCLLGLGVVILLLWSAFG